MIREIKLVDYKDRVFLPLSIVINLIRDNPYLQKVEMSVDELNIELANLLSECAYLHTIDLRAKKYTAGFFATLLKTTEESALKFVSIYYSNNHERENCKEEISFSNIRNRTNSEEIRRYFDNKDVDASIRARDIHVRVYFYIA
ncbi:hypothetical protein PAEPH01_2154 [Pancytospora epiphaga]|nr:hypothetical protein PAEPH01_2154 [Pancytospora epiphaga]